MKVRNISYRRARVGRDAPENLTRAKKCVVEKRAAHFFTRVLENEFLKFRHVRQAVARARALLFSVIIKIVKVWIGQQPR